MKHLITIVTLAAAVLAAPGRRRCGAPATYRCAADKKTMEVCDWDGLWKRLDPGCPSGTACEDDPYGSHIPYCMAVPAPPDGGHPPGHACSVHGQYTCFTDKTGHQGIQICDLSNQLQVVGMCPSYCSNISGLPYCF